MRFHPGAEDHLFQFLRREPGRRLVICFDKRRLLRVNGNREAEKKDREKDECKDAGQKGAFGHMQRIWFEPGALGETYPPGLTSSEQGCPLSTRGFILG